MLAWARQDQAWTAASGPFAARVWPKGDGRFSWQIVVDRADSPAATGVAASRGAAQTACSEYVKRSGRV